MRMLGRRSQRDYLEQKIQQLEAIVDAFMLLKPELPKSSAGADFWLNLGTSILAQPGGRPILQTLRYSR